ncbi:MAG: glycosyltransferase [Bacteroidota bacterium]
MMDQIVLTIVIPCYNEQINLEHGVLEEVYSFLQTLKLSWELIISDDGSTDSSKDLVKKFLGDKKNLCLLENPHGGKPAAILAGVNQARGEYLLFTDMDQSTPLRELEKLLPYLNSYDVIIGSRLDRKNAPFYRQIGSAVFKQIRKLILLSKINDTQCGFKMFRTSLVREVFPKLDFFKVNTVVRGWRVTSFDVELLHIMQRRGIAIKEVTVDWEDRDRNQFKPKGYVRESLEMLKEVIKVKYNDLQGKYRNF